MTNGYYLEKKDFQYFNQMIQTMRTCMNDWASLRTEIQKKVSSSKKDNKIKEVLLLVKVLQIIAYVLLKKDEEGRSPR